MGIGQVFREEKARPQPAWVSLLFVKKQKQKKKTRLMAPFSLARQALLSLLLHPGELLVVHLQAAQPLPLRAAAVPAELRRVVGLEYLVAEDAIAAQRPGAAEKAAGGAAARVVGAALLVAAVLPDDEGVLAAHLVCC
jgi:hypothetical protein